MLSRNGLEPARRGGNHGRRRTRERASRLQDNPFDAASRSGGGGGVPHALASFAMPHPVRIDVKILESREAIDEANGREAHDDITAGGDSGQQLDRRQDRLRLKRLALSQIAAAGRSQSRPSSVTGEMTAPSVQQVADEPESGICPAGTPRSAVGEHPEGEVPAVALANSKGEPQPRYAVQQVHGIQIADPHRA